LELQALYYDNLHYFQGYYWDLSTPTISEAGGDGLTCLGTCPPSTMFDPVIGTDLMIFDTNHYYTIANSHVDQSYYKYFHALSLMLWFRTKTSVL